MMIEPKYHNLNTLFAERVFRIPKYQRYYSWVKKQRDDLFFDILQVKKRAVDQDHFMATIVCFRTDEVVDIGVNEYRMYDIVDGQQRLTTLIMLLKCIELKLSDGEEKIALGKIIVKSDGVLILLQTNNTNKQIFNRFVRNGDIPNKNDLKTHADRNLYNGITDCRKFVNEWYEHNGEVLSLYKIIRNKLGFVVFDTDDPRIVYSIFEVLNSRGLAVDWLDKCKSSLMGIAYEKSSTEDAKKSFINELNDLWGQIYQEISIYPVPGHEILRVTATLFNGDQSGKPQKAEMALSSLLASCQSPEDTIQKTTDIYEVTKKLVNLQTNVHLGPVTYVLQARVLAVSLLLSSSLTEKERDKALSQWEKVTFRIFGIFGKDSRSKVGDYIRLSAKIMSSEDNLRYSEIISAIRKIGEEYPIDEAINEGLKDKNTYDGNQDVIRYILWRYEEYLAKQADSNAIVNEEYKKEIWEARKANETVEHILPQNFEEGGAWDGKIEDDADKELVVNSIGNLLLLPQILNSEVGRKGFKEKKKIYKNSEGLRIVQEVIKESDWSQKEIKKRENKILQWIAEEWNDVVD